MDDKHDKEALKEYTERGLLPNRAGQQELEKIKLREQMESLRQQLEECRKENTTLKQQMAGMQEAIIDVCEYIDNCIDKNSILQLCWVIGAWKQRPAVQRALEQMPESERKGGEEE